MTTRPPCTSQLDVPRRGAGPLEPPASWSAVRSGRRSSSLRSPRPTSRTTRSGSASKLASCPCINLMCADLASANSDARCLLLTPELRVHEGRRIAPLQLFYDLLGLRSDRFAVCHEHLCIAPEVNEQPSETATRRVARDVSVRFVRGRTVPLCGTASVGLAGYCAYAHSCSYGLLNACSRLARGSGDALVLLLRCRVTGDIRTGA